MTPGSEKRRTTIVARKAPSGVVIRIEGPINEHFDITGFVDASTGKIVVVDMDAVDWITSFGVRHWVQAIEAIPNTYLAFINVRPLLVQQFNMVVAFPGDGELVSLYAPYICPSCKHPQEHLFDLLQLYPKVKAFDLPEVRCDACGKPTELDDLVENYLMYVAAAPPPNPPAEYATVLHGTPVPTHADQLRIEKRVEGAVTALILTGRLGEKTSIKRALVGLEGTVAISLSGIRTFDQLGVTALRPLWEANLDIVLAEAPIALLAMLPPECWRTLRVLSLITERHCPSGHILRGTLLQSDQIWRLSYGKPLLCPLCNSALGAEFVGEFAARGALALLTPAIAETVARLIEHQHSTENATELVPPELFGGYKVIKLLATGGMGEVYLAHRSGRAGFEKELVLKRVHPHLARDPEFSSALLQEARLAARVNHPNVVQIYDVGRSEDVDYIAMEYVDRWDLDCLIRYARRLARPFPFHLAARICADVASGLDAAHSALGPNGKPSPILHRDVSPQNILISRHGAVKLTDFGIAKALDSTSQHTPIGRLKGKLAYMAPEAAGGDVSADARVDVFAVGVISTYC